MRRRMHRSSRRSRSLHGHRPRDRHITSAYETYTPEDVEARDTDDRGWINETGDPIELDKYDIEEGLMYDIEEGRMYVDKAVEYLERAYVTEASSYPRWSPGTWYESVDEDLYSTDRTYKHYFLNDFTEDEERAIYDELKRKRVI